MIDRLRVIHISWWILVALSVVSAAIMFAFPPGRKHFGYLLPVLMTMGMTSSLVFAFVARRLGRSDVPRWEMRVRQFLFRPRS